MKLDISRAFQSPFSEEKWYIKLIFPMLMAAYGLLSSPVLFLPKKLLFAITLLCILPNIVLSGFFIQFQHNEIKDQDPLLPMLTGNIKKYFMYGLYGLGISIAFIILAAIVFFVGSIFVKIAWIFKPIVRLALFALFMILVVGFIMALNMYSEDFNFKAAFDYKRILKLLSAVKFEIIIYLIIAIVLCIGINVFSSFTNFMLIISPFFITVIQLILLNLNAQLYKLAKYNLETVASNSTSEPQENDTGDSEENQDSQNGDE